MEKIKDLESLAKFKKLIKEEFYPKLKQELEKLSKKFIYKININEPQQSRGLSFIFYNKEINECNKEDGINTDFLHDILYDFSIIHYAHKIEVSEHMTRYFLIDIRKNKITGKRSVREYVSEMSMIESYPGPPEYGWENKSPFKESQLTDQSHDFKPNQITESFNYFVELIKERARNPYKNYIEALPKLEDEDNYPSDL